MRPHAVSQGQISCTHWLRDSVCEFLQRSFQLRATASRPRSARGVVYTLFRRRRRRRRDAAAGCRRVPLSLSLDGAESKWAISDTSAMIAATVNYDM